MKKLRLVLIMLVCALCLGSNFVASFYQKDRVFADDLVGVKVPFVPVRVAYFSFDGYHMGTAGARSGYGYEILCEMAKYSNFQYTYVSDGCSWFEAQRLLASGEVDLLTSAHKTPEREKEFLFSDYSIGTSHIILTSRSDNTKFLREDYSTFNGMRVGILKGNSRNKRFDEFSQKHNFDYQAVVYESQEELSVALATNDVDTIVTSDLRELKSEQILAKFSPESYYVITTKDKEELMKKVNYALTQINLDNPMLYSDLYNTYYLSNRMGDVSLTEAEYQYLAQKKTVRVAIKPHRAPLSYFNDQGEARGIVVDVLNEITMRTGIQIQYVRAESYADYWKFITDEHVDLIADCTIGLNIAEANGIKMTAPYLNLTYSELSQKKNSHKTKTVAVLENMSEIQQYIENNYNPAQRTTYLDTVDCINAVKSGKNTCTYVYSLTAQQTINDDVKNSLVSTLLMGHTSRMTMGIKSNADIELYSIINKYLVDLGNAHINEIVLKNTNYVKGALTLQALIYNSPVFIIIFFILLSLIFTSIVVLIFITYMQRLKQVHLNESNRLGLLMSEIYDRVAEFDLISGSIFVVNCENENLTRKDSGTFIAQQVQEMIDNEGIYPKDLEKYKQFFSMEEMEGVAAKESRAYCECRIKVSERYQWISFSMQGMVSDHLHKKSVLLYCKNIDQERREEEAKNDQLRVALGVAELASSAKGEFMSRMSHEIRTPLNAVIGYMTIARGHKDNMEKVNDCIEKTALASKHLLAIVNDILDMSAIESGKIKIDIHSFDFKAFISNLSSMYYAQAKQKKVHFHVALEGITEEWLRGDDTRLNQILMNLLSNAIKFTDEGGTVTLLVQQVARKEGLVFLRFIVRDTGIGLSEEFKSRIFQPFEQQDHHINKQFGGTGLGLSICKNLVALMNGAIKVDSIRGEGSTFTVEIPLMQDLDQPIVSKNIIPHFKDLDVLIVDDELNCCEYEAMLMQNCGVNCDFVLSGMLALEKIRNVYAAGGKFDLCLVDWKMPDFNGLQIVRKIREIVGTEMPILVVTAYDYSEIESEARMAGITQFLTKPLFQSTVFDLLVSQYGSMAMSGHKPVETVDFYGKRVLLAEDNDINREIAEELLKEVGLEVVSVVNGEEAVKLFIGSQVGTYQAILMDIQMPVMDGYEATRAIRESEHKEAQDIPILAMTANAFAEDVTAALSAGMNNHISKPIDIDMFYKILRMYIK